VSTTVAVDIDSPSQTDTTWVMQYGQFIDHDFTKTPEFQMGILLASFFTFTVLILNLTLILKSQWKHYSVLYAGWEIYRERADPSRVFSD
jgi:hypothetical protein